MTNAIDLVVALNPDHSAFSALLQQLKATAAVHHIYIATPDADAAAPYTDEHCTALLTDKITGTKFLRTVSQKVSAPYTALYLSTHTLQPGYRCLERMVQAAEENGRILTIGHQSRFSPAAQRLHELCASGALGEIYYARSEMLRRRGVPTWGHFLSRERQGGG